MARGRCYSGKLLYCLVTDIPDISFETLWRSLLRLSRLLKLVENESMRRQDTVALPAPDVQGRIGQQGYLSLVDDDPAAEKATYRLAAVLLGFAHRI